MLNIVTLHGRLTKDPELRYTTTQKSVASFSIAVDRDTHDREADFFSCVAWNGTAEFVKNHFRKGDPIVITGRLQNRSYEDRNNQKRTVTEVLISNFYFAGKKEQTAPGFTEMEDPEEDLSY